jgi:hypothetical protein
VNHEQFVAGLRQPGNLPRDGPHGVIGFEERTGNFDDVSHVDFTSFI